MNEAELNHILDNIDLEHNQELDMTRAEHDLIIERYRRELSQMQLEEFIGCIMEDCYKLGMAKALLMTMDI